MVKPIVIAVDIDDTVGETGKYVIADMHVHLHSNQLFDELEYVKKNDHISPLLWSKEMCDLVSKYVIHPGHYMRHIDTTSLIDDGLADMLRGMTNGDWGSYVKSVVCTHRGSQKWGHTNTVDWLEEKRLDRSFSDVHAISSKDYANKLEFLHKTYPQHEVLLLDDNPFGNPHGVMEAHPDVLIYDREYSLPSHTNQAIYTGIDDLKRRVLLKMFGERGYDRLLQQYAGIL